MTLRRIETIRAWVKETPHHEGCSNQFGDALCSCGKHLALELLDLLEMEDKE